MNTISVALFWMPIYRNRHSLFARVKITTMKLILSRVFRCDMCWTILPSMLHPSISMQSWILSEDITMDWMHFWINMYIPKFPMMYLWVESSWRHCYGPWTPFTSPNIRTKLCSDGSKNTHPNKESIQLQHNTAFFVFLELQFFCFLFLIWVGTLFLFGIGQEY
jgi:hypothetical protein